MKSHAIFALAALLSTSVTAATTTANACTKDPYKALLPLSKYSVAENFCSSKYSLPIVTSTNTVTVTAGSRKKRGSSTAVKSSTTTPAKSTTTSACTGECATWSSCTKKGGDFLSTLCSCIEAPKTTTITKTSTVTRTVTSSAAPTFSCPAFDQTGPPRCNCYYSPFCGSRFTGTVNASTTVSSYEACITFAGNVKTGRAEPADLTYFPATGLCQAFIFQPLQADDPTAIRASAVYNAENCYLQDIQDLNGNGCGCNYAEDCDQGYDGDVYADLPGLGVADCQQACDLADSGACAAFTNSGGAHCTLYRSVADKYNSFGITGYYRASCPNPCVKS